MVMQDVKSKPHENGNGLSGSHNSTKISSSEKQESNGGENGLSTATDSNVSRAPVIAAGTLSGSGKSCHRPSFKVGLLELSISTVFHVGQVLLGYILMLVVMTYNVWIFLAVLIGTGLGFFAFDSFNRKIRALKLNAGGSDNRDKK